MRAPSFLVLAIIAVSHVYQAAAAPAPQGCDRSVDPGALPRLRSSSLLSWQQAKLLVAGPPPDDTCAGWVPETRVGDGEDEDFLRR